MQTLKYLIFVLFITVGLFFFLSFEIPLEYFQSQNFLETAKNSDIIIIFNSGGWGNTPFEKAEDFSPIIVEIQKALKNWGYDSMVIPYNRTKDNFFGKMIGAKDFLNSFKFSSSFLAEEIDFLVDALPDKKFIMAGLSAGGAFATKTYEKTSEEIRDSIIAIAAGTPFWIEADDQENILQLDNLGKDSLARGEMKRLFLSLFKSPIEWFLAKISGQDISFSQTRNQFINHTYNWETSSPEILSFLENKILLFEK